MVRGNGVCSHLHSYFYVNKPKIASAGVVLHVVARMRLSDGAWGHRTPLGPLYLPSSQQSTLQ